MKEQKLFVDSIRLGQFLTMYDSGEGLILGSYWYLIWMFVRESLRKLDRIKFKVILHTSRVFFKYGSLL